jgi:RHS repeat-associated protein
VSPFQYTAGESDPETGLYYYRARYYDQTTGRFLGEDPIGPGPFVEGVNLYVSVENSPTNYVDPLGLYTLKPNVPRPWEPLDMLLKCIEAKSGLSLVVTSTSEPPPLSPHGPNDVHRRGAGQAVDVRYPIGPGAADAVLCGAALCGAGFALDELKHPSRHSTHAHIHIQLPAGPNNSGGDLPKQGDSRCEAYLCKPFR